MKKRIQIIVVIAIMVLLAAFINVAYTAVLMSNILLSEPSVTTSQEPMANDSIFRAQQEAQLITLPAIDQFDEPKCITLPAVDQYDEPKCITLTDMADYEANYDLIRGVILAEARGEGIVGMHAVAQVIYDRVYYYPEEFGSDLYSVLTSPGQFAKPYYCDHSYVTEAAEEVMEAVFVDNYRIWDFPVTYFYNPATASKTGAAYIKTKQYVATVGSHEFRTEWGVDIGAYNQ